MHRAQISPSPIFEDLKQPYETNHHIIMYEISNSYENLRLMVKTVENCITIGLDFKRSQVNYSESDSKLYLETIPSVLIVTCMEGLKFTSILVDTPLHII